MAIVEKACGFTAFASPPAASYRFVISMEAEKMDILFEDLESKRQWRTGFLAENDYVTANNRFPGATVDNYISLFKDTLGYMMDDSKRGNVADNFNADKVRRKLVDAEGNTKELELWVKLKALGSAWTAKFVFQLRPVVLDRIDILEATIRDLKEELKEKKERVEDDKAQNPVHLALELVNYTADKLEKLNRGDSLLWADLEKDDEDKFQLTEEGRGITEADFPADVQLLYQKDAEHKRFLRALESIGNVVEDRAISDVITAGKLTFRTSQLGNSVEAALQSSKLEKIWNYVAKLNKGKPSSEQISVVGTLIGKYGDDAVIKALVNVKQAGDTNSVVTKLEKELFTGWMKNRQLPENVFSKLKISDEGDIVLRIGKIEVLNNYIVFLNGKVDTQDSLRTILIKGFGNEQKALSVLAVGKTNPLTMKKSTELEATLLLQKVEDKLAMTGGLDQLGNNLAKLDDYASSLKKTYGNNDVTMLRTLLVKYSDATVAKALEAAKRIDKKGVATKLQNEQFQIWLKEGKTIDEVFKLLKLNTYGETIMVSRGLDTLESYTAFFNRRMGAKESFINKLSSYLGGDDKFALELLRLKLFEYTNEKATELQNKLFQQWKSEGLDSVSVINNVFKVPTTEKTTNRGILRTAEEYKIFLGNAETTH